MGGIIAVSLIAIIVVVAAIVIDVLLAKKACEFAEEKGHSTRFVFVLTFIMPVLGFAYVAAMPDRSAEEQEQPKAVNTARKNTEYTTQSYSSFVQNKANTYEEEDDNPQGISETNSVIYDVKSVKRMDLCDACGETEDVYEYRIVDSELGEYTTVLCKDCFEKLMNSSEE